MTARYFFGHIQGVLNDPESGTHAWRTSVGKRLFQFTLDTGERGTSGRPSGASPTRSASLIHHRDVGARPQIG